MRPPLHEQLAPGDLSLVADWLADQPRLTQQEMDAFCGGARYDVAELRDTVLVCSRRLTEERP
ncbi:MAG: hypothetical protein ACYDC0_16695 [Acidimicrobiales bacterium]